MARIDSYPLARAKSRGLHIAVAAAALTFTALAAKAGISRAAMYAIAAGLQTPLATAERIAAALGLPVAELFEVIERPAAAGVA